MNIQIFGTKKCKNTAKARRFFMERGIKIHFVDLNEKGISKGELNSILRTVPIEELMDRDSREFEKRNLAYLKHNPEEEILEHPLLVKTPVVRCGNEAAAGFSQDRWKEFAAKVKG